MLLCVIRVDGWCGGGRKVSLRLISRVTKKDGLYVICFVLVIIFFCIFFLVGVIFSSSLITLRRK